MTLTKFLELAAVAKIRAEFEFAKPEAQILAPVSEKMDGFVLHKEATEREDDARP